MVLLDVWLQGSKLDGLQLLQEIKRRDPTLPVLMISGHGNLDTAVAAVREGAVDFIEKPFEAERLLYLVDRATDTERLRRLVARRYQVVRHRTRIKNEVHAILHAHLIPKCPHAELFNGAGAALAGRPAGPRR